MKKKSHQTLQSNRNSALKPSFLLTALMVLIGLSTFAQNPCLRDSTYVYNAQNELIRTFSYAYNSNGQTEETIRRDSINGAWVNFSKTNITWLEVGKYSDLTQQSWVNNQWQNGTRYTYTYNANGDVLTNNTYTWDAASSSWQLSSFQKEYTYNAQFKEIHYLQVYWNNGTPEDSVTLTHTLDVNGNAITTIREGWSISNPTWRILQKWETTYTANNLTDTVYNFIYDQDSLSWNALSKWTYQYDANQNQTAYILYHGHGGYSLKNEYTYDANNNQLSYTYYTWDPDTWRINNQTINTYNSNNQQLTYNYFSFDNNLNQLINSQEVIFSYDNDYKLLEITTNLWDNITNSLVYYARDQNVFNCVTAINEFTESVEIQVFPNPTNGLLHVKDLSGEHLSVLNIQGRQVFRVRLETNDEVIDLSSLPSGIYILKTGNGSTQKIVKQ